MLLCLPIACSRYCVYPIVNRRFPFQRRRKNVNMLWRPYHQTQLKMTLWQHGNVAYSSPRFSHALMESRLDHALIINAHGANVWIIKRVRYYTQSAPCTKWHCQEQCTVRTGGHLLRNCIGHVGAIPPWRIAAAVRVFSQFGDKRCIITPHTFCYQRPCKECFSVRALYLITVLIWPPLTLF